MTYGNREFGNTVSAPAVSVRCLPIAALRVAPELFENYGTISRGIPQAYATCEQIPDRFIP